MFEYMIDLPTKIAFGDGKINETGKTVAKYGKKVFFVMDPFILGSDIERQLLKDLQSNGVDCVLFNDITSNPRSSVVDIASKKCKEENCDVVLAIGGGSAIDTAKAVAIASVNGEEAWLYTTRENEYVAQILKPALPRIVIPTTSGTGTEATPYSVLNNTDLHSKATIISEYCFPTVSIIDPQMMTSMPPMITALTGIDAFAHCLEAYVSKNGSLFINMVALEGIRLFAGNIKECCKNGANLQARANMAWASTLGGIAISGTTTTLPHAVGQALSGLTDAPHGGSIACCISQMIRWALPQGEEKFAIVTEIFNPSLQSKTTREKALALPDILDELFVEILNSKVTMSTYGLTESRIEELAEVAFTTLYGGIQAFPRVATKEELIQLIKICM